jgi:hypothetical protein
LFDWFSASPAYDTPSALLTIYAFWLFLRMFQTSPSVNAERDQTLVVLIIVSVLSVMIKLSALPVLLLLPIAAYLAIRRGLQVSKTLQHPGILLLAVGVVIWLATGIATSGCLLFPAASTCIADLPWSVPLRMAHVTAAAVTGWARSPTADYLAAANGSNWIHSWPEAMLAKRAFIVPLGVTFAVLLPVIGCSVLWARTTNKRHGLGIRRTPEETSCLYGLAVSITGILFWFLLAPDPRFGLGFLLTIIPLASCWGVMRFSPKNIVIQKLTSGPATTVLLAIVAGLYIYAHWYSAELALGSWPSIPVADLRQRTLASGLVVLTPKFSDQCWDAPPPCAPLGSASPDLSYGSFLIWRTIQYRGGQSD